MKRLSIDPTFVLTGVVLLSCVFFISGLTQTLPVTIDVNSLNGINGFQIPGLSWCCLGVSLSSGDINGDGLSDLFIASGSGSHYVIFGTTNIFPPTFNITTLNGANGFQIGPFSLGNSQSIDTGDINGDGIIDIIIGSKGLGSINIGVGFVIFGRTEGFPAYLNISTLDGTNGFKIVFPDTSQSIEVSKAGDINGDDISDLVIGNSYFNFQQGVAYVIFGKRSGFTAIFNVTTLNGANGFTINGLPMNSYLGRSVSAGDINGDGISDIIIGTGVGNGYVIFGKTSAFMATMNVTTLNGTNGFKISVVCDINTVLSCGFAYATAGDINGDGITDIILGNNDDDGYDCYVIFGKQSGFTATMNVTTLNGTNGFQISPGSNSYLGSSFGTAGDINDDGITDLVVGDENLGTSYVIYGKTSFPVNFNVATLDGTNGFSIYNSNTSILFLGSSVSAAGDFNGDGTADLIIGAFGGQNLLGYVFVILVNPKATSPTTTTPVPLSPNMPPSTPTAPVPLSPNMPPSTPTAPVPLSPNMPPSTPTAPVPLSPNMPPSTPSSANGFTLAWFSPVLFISLIRILDLFF